MIGSIKGTVGYLAADYCIIETPGGVGYRVFLPVSQLSTLILGSAVKVLTYTAVREDAILLYGFLTQEYYNLFTLLLGVSGVGPKGAIGVVSAIKPEAFFLAIQSRDLKILTKLPGIGKKTAERMLLELKDKVGSIGGEGDEVFAAAVSGGGNDAISEAVEALVSLGYSNSEIMPVLKKIPDCDKLSGEDIIRKALRLFAAR